MRSSFLAENLQWLVYAFVLASAILVMVLPWSRRLLRAALIRFRLRQATNHQFRLRPVRDIPLQLQAATSALRSLGFTEVTVGRQATGTVSIMLRQEGSVLASAAWMRRPPQGLPGTMVTLSSVATRYRGVLQTSNGGFDMDAWSGAITQVFPDAPLHELVKRHDEALRLLESRGVRFTPIALTQALDVYGWMMSQSVAAVLALSDEDLAVLAKKTIRDEIDLKSVLNDHDTLSAIEAMSS